MAPVRADHNVLIVATDQLLGALIGSLVEATQLRAAYPQLGERPEDALARVRPLVVVLVDALTDEAASDLFVARARKRRVPVLLFGSAAAIALRSDWSQRNDIRTFSMPSDLDGLRAALESTLEQKPRRAGSERRAAHTERGSDGTLIYDDGQGRRWSVYDRRAGDRRDGSAQRRFVCTDGEVRQCDVLPDEEGSTSVAILSRQLARSVPLPT